MILLDTHVLVWLVQEPSKLSPKASQAIRNATGGLAISGISNWELALLAVRGRLKLNSTIEAFIEEITSRTVVLPVTAKVAAVASQFPGNYPKDPADRLIGATAITERIELVSADVGIRRSGVVTPIW